MSRLERRCQLILRAYPGWYRRERAGEMLDTLLEAVPPGQRWPAFADTRTLVFGGLRARGWVWLGSVVWVVAGIAITGYFFYVTTKPFSWADVDLGIEGWSAVPETVRVAMGLATAAWLALLIPVLIAGFIRLRGWRPRSWVRAAVWAGAWVAGISLMNQAADWGTYPGSCGGPCAVMPRIGSPAVVSWGELVICAGWLMLGAVMTVILGGSAPGPKLAGADGRARAGPA